MVLEIAAKDKASPCSRGTNQQVVREFTQPNRSFYFLSLYNSFKPGAQFKILISFIDVLVYF